MKHKPLPELVAVVNKLKQMREVQGVYLFGSYARGTPSPLSDVDLAVITTPLSEEQKTAVVLAGPTNKFDITLLEDLPPAISFRVFKEGRPLWVRDPLFVHRQKMRAISDYLDYKPMLERMTKRVLET
ncbi:nucleotidyltransferase domain-containing protein [Candidatus Woesearchaeota archaeon]|nr:nucleotidyltransferase domain-containing protein [Candidatus Woesearchaeota archaeon]